MHGSQAIEHHFCPSFYPPSSWGSAISLGPQAGWSLSVSSVVVLCALRWDLATAVCGPWFPGWLAGRGRPGEPRRGARRRGGHGGGHLLWQKSRGKPGGGPKRRGVCVIFDLLARCMRPEGPWQRLSAALFGQRRVFVHVPLLSPTPRSQTGVTYPNNRPPGTKEKKRADQERNQRKDANASTVTHAPRRTHA